MQKSNIELVFCGDFAPVKRYQRIIERHDAQIFKHFLNEIRKCDLAFLNLECPLTETSQKVKKAGPNIKASPDSIKAVKNAGFNVALLANNHIMDFGLTGLQDTIKSCKNNNIQWCGAGINLQEAQQVKIFKTKGVRIAIINIAEEEFNIAGKDSPGAAPLDIVDNITQIRQAKENSDIVIMVIHGGNEYFPLPRPGLRKICHFFIQEGVDSIICHHPHIPGAYELHRGKLIVYSQGNFIFDKQNPPQGWDEGYMVKLTIDEKLKVIANYDIIPYKQSADNKGLTKLTDEERKNFFRRMESYEKILKDEDLYLGEWKKFCLKRKNIVLLRQYFPVLFRGLERINKLFPLHPLFFFRSGLYQKLNTIRCQSHHEALTQILELEIDNKKSLS